MVGRESRKVEKRGEGERKKKDGRQEKARRERENDWRQEKARRERKYEKTVSHFILTEKTNEELLCPVLL